MENNELEMSSHQSNANDFDFFIGSWQVNHRKLKKRLADCQDWQAFSGRCIVRKMLGGMGNFDDNLLELPDGDYHAASIRTFNPKTRSWSIWWLDGRNPDQLDTPVKGAFADGIGTFYAEDTLDEMPIKVRFLWTIPAPHAPRWEQAFSVDGGATWETNWIMDFKKIG